MVSRSQFIWVNYENRTWNAIVGWFPQFWPPFPTVGPVWRLYNKIESPVLFQYHIISYNPSNFKINNWLVHPTTIRMSTLITALQFTVPRGVFSAETSEKRHLIGRLWIGICHGVGDTVDRTARLQRVPNGGPWWDHRSAGKKRNRWIYENQRPIWSKTRYLRPHTRYIP